METSKIRRVRASLLANACLPMFQRRTQKPITLLTPTSHEGQLVGQDMLSAVVPADLHCLQHSKPFTSGSHEGQLVGHGLVVLALSLKPAMRLPVKV